jgi:hypothetical protein
VTTLGAYMTQLWNRQLALSGKIGAWLPGMGTDYRVTLAISDASQVVLIKLLVDKGLITDAELVAAFNAATAADFTGVAQQPEPGPSP